MLYVNDSKATNVDACWYALESMKTPVILILGGKDKGNDYNAIKDLVKEKCAGLVYLVPTTPNFTTSSTAWAYPYATPTQCATV